MQGHHLHIMLDSHRNEECEMKFINPASFGRLDPKGWHVLVLIVGVVYKDGEMLCLDYHLHNLLPDFRLLGRIVRPFGETKGGATSGKRNENLWHYRRLKYGIWELNQDVILFLQKVPVR